jgi:hypothetical protein
LRESRKRGQSSPPLQAIQVQENILEKHVRGDLTNLGSVAAKFPGGYGILHAATQYLSGLCGLISPYVHLYTFTHGFFCNLRKPPARCCIHIFLATGRADEGKEAMHPSELQ